MIIRPKIDWGWKRVRSGRVLHYFSAGNSLCGKQSAYNIDRSSWGTIGKWPRCSICEKRYDEAEKQ